MLPDDYIRKIKQDPGEVEAKVESKTRYEPDPDAPPLDDDDQASRNDLSTGYPDCDGCRIQPSLNWILSK